MTYQHISKTSVPPLIRCLHFCSHCTTIMSDLKFGKKTGGKNTDQTFQKTSCLKLKYQNADHGDLKCHGYY